MDLSAVDLSYRKYFQGALVTPFLLIASAVTSNSMASALHPSNNMTNAIQAVSTGHLIQVGRYESGIFEDGGAEIVAFDKATHKVFVINSGDNTIDVLDLTDPAAPVKLTTLAVFDQDSATFTSGGANSVAVANGLLAVAVEADNKQAAGRIYLYNADDNSFAAAFMAGALPDMVKFSPDGNYLLSANEGEPSGDYKNDPEGSITVVNLTAGVASATVKQAGFRAFNAQIETLRADGVRIFGPGATVAMDLEPEYITISADGTTAYVSLQENNAIALVDIATATVTKIAALGFKDHSLQGMGLDANKNDQVPVIESLPIFGMYMPDSIDSYTFNGNTYLVTANEGDGREYIYSADSASCLSASHTDLGDDECLSYSDEISLEDLNLDTKQFSAAQIAMLQNGKGIGDLTVTKTHGDANADGAYEAIYAYGARSFSIWTASGEQVFDSGDQIEQIIADRSPLFFNLSNDKNSVENRSDNKGPEPEGLAVGQIGERTFAFVGLERQGGVMVFDISNPFAPAFVEYTSNRDMSVTPGEGVDAGDLGPEGFAFVKAKDSPNGTALLLIGNEVSGTTTIYEVR